VPILTDQERIGTLLGERYRVEAILGRGGMGVVFRARQEDNGLPVAVKILRPELAQQDPQFAKRFVREARAAAAVRHPNVVEILDVGEEPDGTIYQVLELLVGESLREHLERKERLDPTMMLELLLPVMNALEAAHAAGIVHRDLKPDNIFLARQPSGEAKPTLLDFGIAKLLDTRGGSFATNTGSIMGTPAYMAPEQAGGYKDQGPAIDVWAMGIIAFECLTGSPPFHGSSPAHVMLKIMTEAPPPVDTVVAEIPVGISQAIEKALQRTPADRHHTMAAFRGALRVAAEREGLELPAEGRASTTRVLSIAPRPEEDVASAETDAAVSAKPVSDSGEGFATMQRKLREDRREREQRARADAATRLSTPSSKSANDSIEVSIAAPETRPRWLWLGAAALVVAVLGVGAGLTLAGGGGAPAVTTSSAPSSSTATSVVPPPSPPPTTSVPAATQGGEPPATSDPGVTTPPATIEPPTTARIRVPRGGGTSMSTAMVEAPATTMEAVTMESGTMEPGTMETSMRGGLPSVVGWEDE
jgi:serine/threonine protein kinase